MNILKILALMVITLASLISTAAEAAHPRIELDGVWQLRVDRDDIVRQINVPGCWQSQFHELREYSGKGVFSRSFNVPVDWRDKAVILHFGAIDYHAEVSLNGKRLGEHEGGYTPFHFRIEDSLIFGEDNKLEVTVLDPGPGKPAGDFHFEEIPHGKQSWYGNISGIWQSVYVESRNPTYITNIKATPNIDTGSVEIEPTFSGPGGDGFNVVCQVSEADTLQKLAEVTLNQGPLPSKSAMNISIPDFKLWSPETPNLYRATVRIEKDGKVLDTHFATFGIRKIEAKEGKLYLNNQPVYLISALDQDFYPLHHYTVPSDEYLQDQFKKAKELGLNSLRCHIKVPDPRYLEWADKMGLLIWYEIPSWATFNDRSSQRGKKTLEEMIARDWNHPSLIIISIINESWGIDMSRENQRNWLKEMYDFAKSLNTGRLIVDNSPCATNFHVKTDIDDFHTYFSLPEDRHLASVWFADLAQRPAWTFSPHGDAVRLGEEPLMVSEFGNWGLPSIPKLRECYGGDDPWWFNTGGGNTLPNGAMERFEKWGLDKVYGDWDGMAEVFQGQEWLALKYQIEEIRKHPSITGYVITEFTDLHWESNGLLDYCRNPKTFHNRMQDIQAQDVIIPNWSRTSYWAGERFELPIIVSHFSQTPITDCKLKWRCAKLGLSGEISGVSVESTSAKNIGGIEFDLPTSSPSSKITIDMQLESPDGTALAKNSHEFMLFSNADGNISVSTPIFASSKTDQLRKRGANLVDQPSQADILIIDRLDQKYLDAIKGGKTALFVAKDGNALPYSTIGPQIEDRTKEGRTGNWCNSLIWMKPELFQGVPLPKTPDFSFGHCLPTHVIIGYDPEADQDDILSGIFVGWVNSPAGIAAQFRCGKGKVLVTTFRLLDAYGEDPVATVALNGMINYITSPDFAPAREFDFKFIDVTQTPIPTAEEKAIEWRYTTSQPDAGWEQSDFDDSTWDVGKAGFGSPGTPNAIIGTHWNTSDIWLRCAGSISGSFDTAILRLYHDENVEIYINGREVLSRGGFVTNYNDILLNKKSLASLKQGDNVIAVHCKQTVGGQFIDVGLRLGNK